jgi:hypothetical protein
MHDCGAYLGGPPHLDVAARTSSQHNPPCSFPSRAHTARPELAQRGKAHSRPNGQGGGIRDAGRGMGQSSGSDRIRPFCRNQEGKDRCNPIFKYDYKIAHSHSWNIPLLPRVLDGRAQASLANTRSNFSHRFRPDLGSMMSQKCLQTESNARPNARHVSLPRQTR